MGQQLSSGPTYPLTQSAWLTQDSEAQKLPAKPVKELSLRNPHPWLEAWSQCSVQSAEFRNVFSYCGRSTSTRGVVSVGSPGQESDVRTVQCSSREVWCQQQYPQPLYPQIMDARCSALSQLRLRTGKKEAGTGSGVTRKHAPNVGIRGRQAPRVLCPGCLLSTLDKRCFETRAHWLLLFVFKHHLYSSLRN